MMRRLLLLGLVVTATPAWAQRSLAIKGFDATIAVERDATLDVTETITAQFTGSWNGIYRTIPVVYRSPQGFNWTLGLKLVSATDESGRALKVQASRERHYLKYKIWVPDAYNATHTVTLHYLAYNGLRFFEDHDELYWNVTGDEWDVPLEAASVRITLPGSATGVRAIAFNGAYGSTARDAQVTTSGTTVSLAMPNGLGFREGLTAVVGWDKGAVTAPTLAQRAGLFLTANWPLGAPVLAFLGMFALWYRVGRDPRSLPIAVQYEPPDGLTPGEAGTLIDGTVNMRDITATVVNLAVEGRLKIEETEEPLLLGLFKHKEFVFHRLDPKDGAPPLQAHEESVLLGIFDGTRDVKMSELHNQFYKNVPDIQDGVYERLIQRGLYRTRPDKVKGRWIAAAVLVGMAGVPIIKFALGATIAPATAVIALIASVVIVALFGLIMPARTVLGARTYERVLGFEEFLNRVESENYARVVKTPEMFERFLPYAMAFGVEQRWARAFQDICHEPPTWYVGTGPGTFNSLAFSSRMSSFATSAGSTMGSSPRSSGGSGFGGGSSGGGGGGGGGGGF
jgi:uncharacterized protein (TIGR04222 family)